MIYLYIYILHITGMTFGYRINNYRLFRKGFINEVKMAGGAWILGAFYALILGDLKSNSNQWYATLLSPTPTIYAEALSYFIYL